MTGMPTNKIPSLPELDDGEIYHAYIAQKYTASDVVNLSQLHRLAVSNSIEPEQNENVRYKRAYKKLNDSRAAGTCPGPAYVHVLLRDPSLWKRDDSIKATAADWEYIEQLEEKKAKLLANSKEGQPVNKEVIINNKQMTPQMNLQAQPNTQTYNNVNPVSRSKLLFFPTNKIIDNSASRNK